MDPSCCPILINDRAGALHNTPTPRRLQELARKVGLNNANSTLRLVLQELVVLALALAFGASGSAAPPVRAGLPSHDPAGMLVPDGCRIEVVATALCVPATAIFDGNDLIAAESGRENIAPLCQDELRMPTGVCRPFGAPPTPDEKVKGDGKCGGPIIRLCLDEGALQTREALPAVGARIARVGVNSIQVTAVPSSQPMGAGRLAAVPSLTGATQDLVKIISLIIGTFAVALAMMILARRYFGLR